MPDTIQPDSGKDISSEKTEKLFHIRLRLIVLFALIVVGFFFLLYAFDRQPSEGLKLLTANVLSLAVLVVICIQAYIYSRQRRHMEEQSEAMREQLEAMRRQQAVVDRQLIVSGIQADAALNQWTVMREQGDSMEDTLIETRKIAVQTERAVLAAQQSAKIAEAALYAGEAPYFGITRMEILDFQTGNQPRLAVYFMNGGKTPAWHFHTRPELILGERPDDGQRIKCNAERGELTKTFIPPGDFALIEYQTMLELTAERFNEINNQRVKLFVVIKAIYMDRVGGRKEWHRHTFKYVWNPLASQFYDYEAIDLSPGYDNP